MIFDIFQYYSKLTNIVFARLFYDSIFNINDVYSLFDDTYINIYMITKLSTASKLSRKSGKVYTTLFPLTSSNYRHICNLNK